MNTAWLVLSLLFGAVGLGYFVYGRKQRAIAPLLAGLALMLFPYFIASTAWLIVIGCALLALPFFLRF